MNILEILMIVVLMFILCIPITIILLGILWVVLKVVERIDNFIRKYHEELSDE